MLDYRKMEKHLYDATDPILIILKTHLIIEENLYIAVCNKLNHPSHIEDARLSFSQLLKIAKSIYFNYKLDAVWVALDSLNKIRNRFSHNLEPRELEGLYRKVCFQSEFPENLSKDSPDFISMLQHTSGILIGFSLSLAEHD